MNDKCSNCGIRDATHDGYCGPCSVDLAREHARQMWNYPPGKGYSDAQYHPDWDPDDPDWEPQD